MKNTDKMTTSIKITVKDQIILRAEKENRSLSNMVETAIIHYLKTN